ncbi:MAG: SPASM domain-containing protein [Lachnospiraceae bacterium]|nr:SPASM domain-containing protein [Lachnospiraceae bacterium]
MSIKIVNYAGRFGWDMRKYFPRFAAWAYLTMQFLKRDKEQREFIDLFLEQDRAPYPDVVNIETINRCNSTCAFCTANRYAEKRPFARMEEGLFHKIIDELADWGYPNKLTLYGNNEPWMDTRIVDFHKYAREKLKDCYIFMSTNGLLLDIDKVDQIVPYVNQLIINNYSDEMKLHKNIQEIYLHAKNNPEKYKDVEILIQIRYINEYLTNRAGSAPNRAGEKFRVIKKTCLMPYTDFWIEPNGNVGLCCCDNFEKTSLGDLNKETIPEVWNNEKFRNIREAIRNGRQNYPFCKYCDFIDAGLRGRIMKEEIKKMKS